MRRLRRRAALLLAGVLTLALPGGAQAEDDPKCQAPDDLVRDDPRLPVLSQRLKDKGPIKIVAIGGGSTAGTGEPNSWPFRLGEALRRRHPGQEITVINKGIKGQTTEQMAARFATDVYPDAPDLVIWETGIVDAVRGNDVEEFARQLQSGLAALREHKAEVLLVDMQYNPGTNSVLDYQPYLDALHRSADLADIFVFHRFEIMKYWSVNGVFDLDEVRPAQIYHCLGERLADAIDIALTEK